MTGPSSSSPVAARRRLYLALWVGWAALTFTLTSIPNVSLKVALPGADKLAHLGFYGVMAFLFVLWRRACGAPVARAILQALCLAALAGCLDEVHQRWIPGRSCDPLDWLADTAGGGCGALVSSLLSVRFPFMITE